MKQVKTVFEKIYVGRFHFLLIWDLWGLNSNAVVVFCLAKEFLSKRQNMLFWNVIVLLLVWFSLVDFYITLLYSLMKG